MWLTKAKRVRLLVSSHANSWNELYIGFFHQWSMRLLLAPLYLDMWIIQTDFMNGNFQYLFAIIFSWFNKLFILCFDRAHSSFMWSIGCLAANSQTPRQANSKRCSESWHIAIKDLPKWKHKQECKNSARWHFAPHWQRHACLTKHFTISFLKSGFQCQFCLVVESVQLVWWHRFILSFEGLL